MERYVSCSAPHSIRARKKRESSVGFLLQDQWQDSVCKPVYTFLWLRVYSFEQLCQKQDNTPAMVDVLGTVFYG